VKTETGSPGVELRNQISEFDVTPAAELRNFARRLRDVIGAERPTAFARRAGVDEKSMRDYLAARGLPRGNNLLKIARAAGVSTEALFREDAPPVVAERFEPYQARTGIDVDRHFRSPPGPIRRRGGGNILTSEGIGSRISAIADGVGGRKALAKATGISLAQLYRYISERSGLPLDAAIRIADVGGRPLNWLVGGDEEAPPHVAEASVGYQPTVDIDRLVAVIEGAERALQDRSVTIGPRRKARLIAKLYAAAIDGPSLSQEIDDLVVLLEDDEPAR
jgi:transcriptional regulator with XRE-family HTH domain